MRKLISFVLILSLISMLSGCDTNDTKSIGIIPLDSRPCNTQYAQLLGEMAGYKVLMPDKELLDCFTDASEADALWNWLEHHHCDYYILFTNQLLSGGLINSRSLSGYVNEDSFFQKLSAFLETHKNSEITIISVLPRLLPSQYDSELWLYQKELSAYGSALDQSIQENLQKTDMPDDVPVDIVEQYIELYQTNYDFLNKLSKYAQNNVSLVIGQDDAQQYCPSNAIYRSMEKLENENITTLHGADELTMLTIARYNAKPVSLNILYSDENYMNTYYPYEAADLKTVIQEKANYVNINIDEKAKDTLIIHVDPASLQQTKDLLCKSYGGYLALADIAYTNKGDIALADTLLEQEMFQKIHCYSGWNTASNTIGTVLAHYQLSTQYVDSEQAAKAALEFKLVRYSEDQIYQGSISNSLRNELLNSGQMDTTTTFSHTDAYINATELLRQHFAPYGEQLRELVYGTQNILPGYTLNCTEAVYNVSFPWTRAFEIYAQWDINK